VAVLVAVAGEKMLITGILHAPRATQIKTRKKPKYTFREFILHLLAIGQSPRRVLLAKLTAESAKIAEFCHINWFFSVFSANSAVN